MLEVILTGLITAIVGANLTIAIKNATSIGEFKGACKKMNGIPDRLEKLEKRMEAMEKQMTQILTNHNNKRGEG